MKKGKVVHDFSFFALGAVKTTQGFLWLIVKMRGISSHFHMTSMVQVMGNLDGGEDSETDVLPKSSLR